MVCSLARGCRAAADTFQVASLPPPSTATTPLTLRERKIRCKMCRQELAMRKHMMPHNQPPLPLIMSDHESPEGLSPPSEPVAPISGSTPNFAAQLPASLGSLRDTAPLPPPARPNAPRSPPSSTPGTPPPILNAQCSGYFLEPVCLYFHIILPVIEITLSKTDEMDGCVPRRREPLRKDHMPKQEV